MLTITQSRQLSVLVALRDATGDKTRTRVSESAVVEQLRRDAGFAGSVPDELDDLERQGFALISSRASDDREVEMTAHGKMKAEEFSRLRARGTTPPHSEPAPNDRSLSNPTPIRRSSNGLQPADRSLNEPRPTDRPPSGPIPFLRSLSEPQARRSAPPSAHWSVQAREVLDAAAQAISLLPPDTAPVVRILVEDARGAVSAGSAPRTRRALNTLGGYLADPASGALGNVLAARMLALAPPLAPPLGD